MKAKELAKILLQNPEAEVVHYQYTGGDTPLLKIDTVIFECKGEQTESYDKGHFINRNGKTKCDILILKYLGI
jgi:hypothetical protein